MRVRFVRVFRHPPPHPIFHPHVMLSRSYNDILALRELCVLQDEDRRRRREAERHLNEVREECREPFVVPALLEAFAIVKGIDEV